KKRFRFHGGIDCAALEAAIAKRVHDKPRSRKAALRSVRRSPSRLIDRLKSSRRRGRRRQHARRVRYPEELRHAAYAPVQATATSWLSTECTDSGNTIRTVVPLPGALSISS